MIVYENHRKDIQRISEMKLFLPFQSIPFNATKSIIAMFLSELLVKCLKEESANPEKFNFLLEQIALFDQLKESVQDFHISFMIKLSSFLGFAPNKVEDFISVGMRLNGDQIKNLNKLFELDKMPQRGEERSQLLDLLIKYYQYHIDNFGAFKSINVLREVVHN